MEKNAVTFLHSESATHVSQVKLDIDAQHAVIFFFEW